jgi:hypothetical protein
MTGQDAEPDPMHKVPASVRTELELQKLKVEIKKIQAESQIPVKTQEKLDAEIEDLRKPLWRKPPFYAAVTPVCLAIIGLIFTWSSGWFDAQQKRLDAQRTSLEFEVKQLDAQKKGQEWTATVLQKNIGALQAEKDSLSNQVATLQNDLKILTRSNETYRGEYTSLLVRFSRAQEERLSLEQKSHRLDVGINQLGSEIADTKTKLQKSINDREILLKDLQRLEEEKRGLEKQFSVLGKIRNDVANLKEELSIARRLEWIRRGKGVSNALGLVDPPTPFYPISEISIGMTLAVEDYHTYHTEKSTNWITYSRVVREFMEEPPIK